MGAGHLRTLAQCAGGEAIATVSIGSVVRYIERMATYTITLRADTDLRGLRLLLKRLLRWYGLRCVDVREDNHHLPPIVYGMPHGPA